MGHLMYYKFPNVFSCYYVLKFHPSVLAKHSWLNNVVAAYFSKICIRLAARCSVIIIRWPLARGKFQTVSRQPSANYYKFGYLVSDWQCELHPASGGPNDKY
jgi:hypothetical protein